MTPLSRLRTAYQSRVSEFGLTDRGRIEVRVMDLKLILEALDAVSKELEWPLESHRVWTVIEMKMDKLNLHADK